MITFGFKSKFGGWLRGVLAIALGAIMVACPATSLILVVKIIAACLVISGIVSLVYGIASGSSKALPLMIVNSIVDIVLGAVIFSFPGVVAGMMMWVYGAALVIFGIYQLIVLASAFAFLGFRFLAFVLPSLCIIGGTLVLFNPFGSAQTLTVVAGVCVAVYGLSELCATLQMRRAQKAYGAKLAEEEELRKASEMLDAIDVEYEKIDEQ